VCKKERTAEVQTGTPGVPSYREQR